MSVLKIPLPDSINETLSANELSLEAQHISMTGLDLLFCLRLNPLNETLNVIGHSSNIKCKDAFS